MATWRYTADYFTPATEGGMTEVITPHACPAETQGAAVAGLEAFLDGQRQEHGENLQWVNLERSDSGAEPSEHEGGWTQVKRLEFLGNYE